METLVAVNSIVVKQLGDGVIPEPFSLAFMGSAFVGVVAIRLRKYRRQERAV